MCRPKPQPMFHSCTSSFQDAADLLSCVTHIDSHQGPGQVLSCSACGGQSSCAHATPPTHGSLSFMS